MVSRWCQCVSPSIRPAGRPSAVSISVFSSRWTMTLVHINGFSINLVYALIWRSSLRLLWANFIHFDRVIYPRHDNDGVCVCGGGGIIVSRFLFFYFLFLFFFFGGVGVGKGEVGVLIGFLQKSR